MSGGKVGRDFKTFWRTRPLSVGRSGIEDACKVFKGILPSYYLWKKSKTEHYWLLNLIRVFFCALLSRRGGSGCLWETGYSRHDEAARATARAARETDDSWAEGPRWRRESSENSQRQVCQGGEDAEGDFRGRVLNFRKVFFVVSSAFCKFNVHVPHLIVLFYSTVMVNFKVCEKFLIDYNIKWSIQRKATEYQNTTTRCNLCLAKKVEIIVADKDRSQNKRTELISKSRHENKFYLSNFQPWVPLSSIFVLISPSPCQFSPSQC